jgi:NADPH2:quinone reductase
MTSHLDYPLAMKAVQLSRFGGPDLLEIVEVPIPNPKPEQVLVRVRAAGVNFFDTLIRQNRFAAPPKLPMILGVEAAGLIEVLGEGADPSLLGARVAVPLFAVGRGSADTRNTWRSKHRTSSHCQMVSHSRTPRPC